MTTEQLRKSLRTDQQVVVHCRTTPANIYFRCKADEPTSRVSAAPVASQLQAIPYTITGQVVALREGENTDYLIVKYIGEGVKIDNFRIVGTEMRLKECQIPIRAIERITTADEWLARMDYKVKQPANGYALSDN